MASTDVPASPKSAMDGYALAYEPSCDEYIVDGIIGAGVVWDKTVATGHAVRIMTGAPVPSTCDTVIMQEQVTGTGEIGSIITIQGNQKKGSHIIPCGEECTAGTVVIPKGTENNLYSTDYFNWVRIYGCICVCHATCSCSHIRP